MGGDSIHASIEAIRHIEAALGRFAARLSERLPAVSREIRKTEDLWSNRVRELRREIATLESQVGSRDDDESDWVEQRLDEARQALDEVERLGNQIEEAQALWTGPKARAEGLSGEEASRARAFLRDIQGDLLAYQATTLDGSASVSGQGGWNDASVSDMGTLCQMDVSRFSLPDGFVWVPIENIERSSDDHGYASADRFEKTPREVMENGFALLRLEVLPTISLAPTANSQTFLTADRVAHRPYEVGAQGAYDAFFGDAPIVLTRPRGPGPLEITDGRHRILVAQGLGWPAVPARII